jgi:hypothetical protein
MLEGGRACQQQFSVEKGSRTHASITAALRAESSVGQYLKGVASKRGWIVLTYAWYKLAGITTPKFWRSTERTPKGQLSVVKDKREDNQ